MSIEDRKFLEKIAYDIGHKISLAIDDEGKDLQIGFALLIFDFGENGNLAWVSNAERQDMINALREFIEKEGIN